MGKKDLLLAGTMALSGCIYERDGILVIPGEIQKETESESIKKIEGEDKINECLSEITQETITQLASVCRSENKEVSSSRLLAEYYVHSMFNTLPHSLVAQCEDLNAMTLDPSCVAEAYNNQHLNKEIYQKYVVISNFGKKHLRQCVDEKARNKCRNM